VTRLISVAALLFAAPLATVAHHSVTFYSNEVIEIAGELTRIEWRNPHIRLTLEATNDRGLTELWEMEGSSIYNLERSGITADTFEIGQRLVITGQPSTREERTLLLREILLPDGRALQMWIQNVTRLESDTRLVDAAAENRGIFRVWSVPAANLARALAQLRDQPFTDAAIAARADWDPLDNFATRCEPEGMPRIMVNPHPFEFIDHGDTITLRTELYDVERTIHMDEDAPRLDVPPSRLGHSVGRWVDSDLVVVTTRVNWPYFDNAGTPLGEDAEVTERFSLSEDQTRLDFEVSVADSSTFTEPAVLAGYWLALGDTIARYDCVPIDN
jgi:hypothetical protein